MTQKRLDGTCALVFALGIGLVACSSSSAEAPPDEKLSLSLDLDIRDHVDLRIERRGDALAVSAKLSKGFGVLPENTTLRGQGRLERFPEADLRLYTARFALAPVAGGPCGQEPVSLALSLQRRGDAPRFSGSLTPYCGKDRWAGIPARNPLRMATPPPTDE